MNEEESDIELVPPTKDRVVRRAWAIAAVTCRAFLEISDNPHEAAAIHSRLLAWIDTVGLHSELEPAELEMIETELGELDQRATTNGTWRAEGLVVLAWALGKAEIPPHDRISNPYEVSDSIYFLSQDALNLSKNLRLREPEELAEFSEQQLGLHWRIRDYSLTPQEMDFRKFATKTWFGTMSLKGIPLADDDLAINGMPISVAPESEFQLCQSIAMERHQAINWLDGWDEIYSQVDTST
ncbi:MAG: DUF4272 domain-containing protein [Verrucomicrobiaceae bacterium]|nr:MAG: DUF4272 domain-containing protein [Verrucomicrobiaceae bacterium]